MMMPMKLIMFSVFFVSNKATTTPISDSGSDNMTDSGAVNEPNCMTRIRYISPIPITSAISISENNSFWSRAVPPSSMPYPGGKSIALAIFKASAVTSPGERPCALAVTEIMRLPSLCSIFAGPLPIVIVAIWSSGTIMFVPLTAIGSRSMFSALTRSSGCKRTATSRDSPVGSTQSPISIPANATRKACAASPTLMPSEFAKPRFRSIFNSSFGSCSDKPTSTAPGTFLSLSMKSFVMVSKRRASGPENWICTGLRAPLFKSSSTTYSAPTIRAIALRNSVAISVDERLRSVLLPMST